MPSKKISAITIVCIAIVFSVWLIQNKISFKTPKKNIGILETKPSVQNTYADWQKIISDNTNGTTISDMTLSSTTELLNNTLTGQISGDFLARYLSAKQQLGGGEITTDQANQIANDTLAGGNYTSAVGIQYSIKNLNIAQNSDKATVQKYGETIALDIEKTAPKNSEDVVTITENALQSGKESDLVALDQIISSIQNLISYMLKISVPKDAVDLHLAFINSLSSLLEDTKTMRKAFVDPVKVFVTINSYDQHTQDLQNAMQNLDTYFSSKQ